MATNKIWYIRRPNPSKVLRGEWVYYVGEDCWAIDISHAKKFYTKKAATAFSSDIEGEIYGE
jgi:hypothetical protein